MESTNASSQPSPRLALPSADGCSVRDYCPCDGVSNHGQYVSCVTKAAKDLSKDGVITNQDHSLFVVEAAQSVCGK
jgi:hypothetical protein